MAPEALIILGVLFVFVTGANDGGALIAPGLRLPSLSVATSLAMLTVAVVAYPLLVSTAVAETLMTAIVPAGTEAATALPVGFVAAVVVATSLAWLKLPTSLTLAVIGGIAGAGSGAGLPVDWATLTRVLAIGLAAPVVGAVLGLVGGTVWRSFRNASYLSTVRRAHVVAYTAQCVAYAANDGQKMLVLFLAAGGVAGGPVWWVYPILAVAFAGGAAVGLPRVARTLGAGIMNTGATHTVTAEFAAAAAVLGSAAAGTPVSMTQSIAGGLLGAGVHDSFRRVRWRVVRNLALAWVITLPASFALAASTGLLLAAFGV